MIKKIVRIKNVGKFVNCNAAGDVEFRRLTLLYAENGRGKTTFADILRSLQSGDGSFVVGRRTLGSPGPQEIEVRVDGSTTKFENGAWDQSLENIRFFGPEFIHENVYAGDAVAHEHKKNLYKVILGEEGVLLARRVDELDAGIRDCNRDITVKKAEVQKHVPEDVTLEVFLGLQLVEEIDTRIAESEKRVAELGRAAEISAAELIANVNLPALPADFETVLLRTLADVSRDAETKVLEHIREHTSDAMQSWLSDGVGYTREDICPYCGQSTRGLDIIATYRGYFGTSYNELTKAIATLRTDTAKLADEAALLRIQGVIQGNGIRSGFWRQMLAVDLPELVAEHFNGPLGSLMEAALAEIRDKEIAPLDARIPGDDFQRSQASYRELKATVDAYNAVVDTLNETIRKKKVETEGGDLETAKKGLVRLKAAKKRHEEAVESVCGAYQGLLTTKAGLDGQKTAAKSDLDRYSGSVMTAYEFDLNRLLGNFGAGFRIGSTERSYQGGTPSSSYQIVINRVAVDLGDARTPRGVPSFKNTLSAGDRSTLGLAFFLAKLERDANIADRVVVFDDPFTSQDGSRRTCTQQRICRLAGKANQVIVLSHSPGFLRLIWDECSGAEVKTLQLTRLGQNTTMTQWDIEDATETPYCKNHGILTRYRNEATGTPREVAKTIRLLVEGYLRLKFPGAFGRHEELGAFIGKIRNAQPGDPLVAAQCVVGDLEEINGYSRRYHHDQNPAADTEPIDDAELAVFVGRALDLVGGF